MKAAIYRRPHEDLPFEEVEVDRPMAKEVLVRTVATGVCHSDGHYIEGTSPIRVPAILGHEAAGVVEAVGEHVTYVKPGDHVVACLSAFCGQCHHCLSGHSNRCRNPLAVRQPGERPRRILNGQPVEVLAGVGSFAEKMLLHEGGVVKIDPSIPLDRAALVSCGVLTGFGAAVNSAKVEPGSACVVIGCGGVGLSAIQGCRVAGARRIIAVDTVQRKLDWALEFGATHAVDATKEDPVEAVMRLTDGLGADYAFEAIGMKATAEQAIACIQAGGLATIVGVLPHGAKIELEPRWLLADRRVQGSSMGGNRFRVDIPRLLEYYRLGMLRLDEMITKRGRLEDLNDCFRAMQAGEVARSVLLFD